MTGLEWTTLAKSASQFFVVAREKHFSEDIIKELERRLYKESPFDIHHKKKFKVITGRKTG